MKTKATKRQWRIFRQMYRDTKKMDNWDVFKYMQHSIMVDGEEISREEMIAALEAIVAQYEFEGVTLIH